MKNIIKNLTIFLLLACVSIGYSQTANPGTDGWVWSKERLQVGEVAYYQGKFYNDGGSTLTTNAILLKIDIAVNMEFVGFESFYDPQKQITWMNLEDTPFTIVYDYYVPNGTRTLILQNTKGPVIGTNENGGNANVYYFAIKCIAKNVTRDEIFSSYNNELSDGHGHEGNLNPNDDNAVAQTRVIQTLEAVNDENSTWANTPVTGNVFTNDYSSTNEYLYPGPREQVYPFGFDLNGMDALGVSDVFFGAGIDIPGIDETGSYVAVAGTLRVYRNASGSFNVGDYIFTPATGFRGTAYFDYIIKDTPGVDIYNYPIPEITDTGRLEITVSPLPDDTNSVISNDDEYYTYGSTLSGDVTLNDRDPQEDIFSVTGITYVTDNIGTTATVSPGVITLKGYNLNGQNPVFGDAGTLTIGSDGSFTFEPDAKFVGEITFTYEITDADGAKDTATVKLNIAPKFEMIIQYDFTNPSNLPELPGAHFPEFKKPIKPFLGDDFTITGKNTKSEGNSFYGNDYSFNTDGDPLNSASLYMNDGTNDIEIVPTGGHTTLMTKATEQGGEVTFYTDGTYDYMPPSNYIGPDLVTYTLCDTTTDPGNPTSCANGSIHMLTMNNTVCFTEPNLAGTPLNTQVGISTLGRDAFNGVWPQNRQGAWIAMESNSKGFVPTRATTLQIEAITNPVIGMLVYDTDAKCLKINTDGTQTGWHCFTAPACDD